MFRDRLPFASLAVALCVLHAACRGAAGPPTPAATSNPRYAPVTTSPPSSAAPPLDVRVIPVAKLAFKDHGWWRDWATVSFPGMPPTAPGYLALGPLVLFSLSEIDAGKGFPPHDHEEVESITFMLRGTLMREDTTGARGSVRASEVSVMSAGTGIRHKEWADAADKVRALVIWLRPSDRGKLPRFEEREFPRKHRVGRFVTVASGRAGAPPEALPLRLDAALLATVLTKGEKTSHVLEAGRTAYLMPLEGTVRAGGRPAGPGDRVVVRGRGPVTVEAEEATEVVVLDLPEG